MKGFTATLRSTYAYGFVGLLLGSYAGSLLFATALAVEDGITLKSVLLLPLTGLYVSAFALGFGIVPAALVCIPLYALLRHMGKDSYGAAAAVGASPSVVMLSISGWEIGALFAGYGVIVGLLTHYTARTATIMAMRSNNSFKPNPLRGSA